jgi:hypothetical protein
VASCADTDVAEPATREELIGTTVNVQGSAFTV